MPVRLTLAAFALLISFLSSSRGAHAQNGYCSGMTVGQLTSLNGFVPFPASSLWNTDISSAPVDPNSANIINYNILTPTINSNHTWFEYSSVNFAVNWKF